MDTMDSEPASSSSADPLQSIPKSPVVVLMPGEIGTFGFCVSFRGYFNQKVKGSHSPSGFKPSLRQSHRPRLRSGSSPPPLWVSV